MYTLAILTLCRYTLPLIIFANALIVGSWFGERDQYLISHSLAVKFPAEKPLKCFLAWFAWGGFIFFCAISASDYKPKRHMYFGVFFAVAFFAVYTTFLAAGSTMGVGEACVANRKLCFLEHFSTFWGLLIFGIIVFDIVASKVLLDEYGRPKPRQQPTPAAAPQRPPTAAPSPTPAPPQPITWSSVLQNPQQQTPQREQDQDRQSILSSVTTLQGEETKTKKDKKRDSTITIYSIEEHELERYLEQTNVPNPSNGNPGSMPNKGP
ncbi:MAG: hypothetical protein J3R72DRAFT_429087 [Linnemannia gamsii]|nr:MAG: hypothetical protein J3R72DRAFT_429087 [Linnemannia gamsii]